MGVQSRRKPVIQMSRNWAHKRAEIEAQMSRNWTHKRAERGRPNWTYEQAEIGRMNEQKFDA